MSASTSNALVEKSVREMQSTSSMVYGTMSDPGGARPHVISSQSSVSDVKTTCERRKRKSCRKALVKFDEFVMPMTIEKPKDKGKVDANPIMLDFVDRSDEVVPTTDRVVKARIVYRVPKERRDGARDTRSVRGVSWQQTSAETARGELRARVSDLWSSTLRWDVQLAGSQPRDRRKIFTHTRAVKDVTLQDATVNAACVASVRRSWNREKTKLVGVVSSERQNSRSVDPPKIVRDVVWQRREKRCRGLYGKECRERIRVAVMCDEGQQRLRMAEERLAPEASATRAEAAHRFCLSVPFLRRLCAQEIAVAVSNGERDFVVGSARHRRERRLRCFLRHEEMAVRMALVVLRIMRDFCRDSCPVTSDRTHGFCTCCQLCRTSSCG